MAKKIHHDASLLFLFNKADGPFGIAFVGDPHIDDMDVTEALLHDLKMMRDANMMGICVGDIGK